MNDVLLWASWVKWEPLFRIMPCVLQLCKLKFKMDRDNNLTKMLYEKVAL